MSAQATMQLPQHPHALFISDLHLCISRPHITQLFIRFIHEIAIEAEYVFVLGDFFEYWAGDDDLDDPAHQPILDALLYLSQLGVKVYWMHGNRDFLLGEAFTKRIGAHAIQDPTLCLLYGFTVLLSHGDILCTDDTEYQQFRSQVRSPTWQTQFLGQSLAERKGIINTLRAQSEQAKSEKMAAIMDVNDATVRQLIVAHQSPEFLIHGHTHRPGHHFLTVNNQVTQRFVLADWYNQASYLRLDNNGVSSYSFA